jgi:CO/xanthine dehydrogenase FAD-binding subunit
MENELVKLVQEGHMLLRMIQEEGSASDHRIAVSHLREMLKIIREAHLSVPFGAAYYSSMEVQH